MKKKIRSWSGATTLGELGIEKSEIGAIAANTVEFGLTGTLKVLNENDIIEILKLAL